MAEAPKASDGGPKSELPKPVKPPPQGNPALRALGLPRLRLPSRNWTIFLTIIGSWTGAWFYDRREKKRIQKKWCSVVEHLASEPLPTNQLQRRLTIFLSAPPGDGLRTARDHFREYVKPVLVAAAMDWDVVEGRREGEVRHGLAERIRRYRKQAGEASTVPIPEDTALALEKLRTRLGVEETNGPRGDIIVGRHTWKEYIRGLHEGWLGPIDPLPQPEIPKVEAMPDVVVSPKDDQPTATFPSDYKDPQETAAADDKSASEKLDDDTIVTEAKDAPTEEAKQKTKPDTGKPPVLPAFIATTAYSTATLPSSIPHELTPSVPIPFPHILGFLKFPIRMYRFLNRRTLADDIGREVAAAILAHNRLYQSSSDATPEEGEKKDAWEQQGLLRKEEGEWNKASRKRKDDDPTERVWLDDMVLDKRIAARMRRFEVTSEHGS